MALRDSINLYLKPYSMITLALCLMCSWIWAGTTTEKRPRIFLEYNTSEEPIDAKAVKMWLNDIEVSSEIMVLPGEVSFKPKEDLKTGNHRVKVLLVDLSGDRVEKEWSFTVTESRRDKPWQLTFAKNSLANGQVIQKPQVELKLKLKGAKHNQLNWSCYLSRNGGSYERQVWSLHEMRSLRWETKNLNDGSYTVEIRAHHQSQGNEQRISTSFVVDRRAPALASLRWSPALHTLGRPQSLSFKIVDPPWNSAKKVKVSISGPEGQNWTSSLEHQSSAVQFDLDHQSLKGWGEGLWPAKITLEDYAGHSTENNGHFLQIVSDTEQLLGEDLILETYPRVRSDFKMDLRGRTNMYGSIILWVNGEQRSQRSLGSHLSEAGVFELKNISLEAGINALDFDIFNSEGVRMGQRRKAAPVLVDGQGPSCSWKGDLAIGSTKRPSPELVCEIKDFSDEHQSNEGVGVDWETIVATLDDETITWTRNGDRLQLSLDEPLSLGKRVFSIQGQDRFGNLFAANRELYVKTGRPKSLELSVERDELIAHASEHVRIHAKLLDHFNRSISGRNFALDITVSQGSAPKKIAIENGLASFLFAPGQQVGSCSVKVQLPGSSLSETLRFKVNRPTDAEPFSSRVSVSSRRLIADGGSSRAKVSVDLKDAEGRRVPDGMKIRLVGRGLTVSQATLTTQKGRVSFEVSSGQELGNAEAELYYLNFKKVIPFQLVAPPPGSVAKLECELWPKQVIAGSKLPIRLTVKAFDRYGQLVADGTGIRFSADRGWVKSFIRTKRGQVINNILAPKEEGLIRLEVKADDAVAHLDIPVLSGEQDHREVKAIQLASPHSFLSSDTIVIEGQILDEQRQLLNRSSSLWLSRGDWRQRILVRSGVFRWRGKLDLEAGQHLFTLECEGYSQGHRLNINTESEAPKIEEENVPTLFDMDFELYRKEGSFRSGAVVIRELDFKGKPHHRDEPLVVTLKSPLGEIPSRVYLSSGSARVPFQYVIQDRPFELIGQIDKQSISLTIPAEKAPGSERSPQAPEPIELVDSDIESDNPQLTSPVDDQNDNSVEASTENQAWSIEKGLQTVLLSGRTDLEAGGRDRTRLRIRLLDLRGQDLPDGTEVVLDFRQGRVSPSRLKVKRGVIKFQIKTETWVGRYPLRIRIGDLIEEIPISIRAPQGDSDFLPGLPTAPQWRGKGRRF